MRDAAHGSEMSQDGDHSGPDRRSAPLDSVTRRRYRADFQDRESVAKRNY
jgi:hypothetical protein